VIFAKLPAVVLAGLLTWLLSSPAVAATPSFPCTGNLTSTEKVICSDDGLASLDVALAAAYKSKLENPGPRDYSLDDPRDAIPMTQKAWLAHRNSCGADKTCIRKAYVIRTTALTAGANTKDTPCSDTVGAKQAAVYVKQCIAVAPETHPPCNALNTCEMIISHNIYRCFEMGNDAPKFCASYPPPP
jgi:uncharacterized protein